MLYLPPVGCAFIRTQEVQQKTGVQVRKKGMSGNFQGLPFKRIQTTKKRQGDLIFKITLITRCASHRIWVNENCRLFPCAYYYVFLGAIPR